MSDFCLSQTKSLDFGFWVGIPAQIHRREESPQNRVQEKGYTLIFVKRFGFELSERAKPALQGIGVYKIYDWQSLWDVIVFAIRTTTKGRVIQDPDEVLLFQVNISVHSMLENHTCVKPSNDVVRCRQ